MPIVSFPSDLKSIAWVSGVFLPQAITDLIANHKLKKNSTEISTKVQNDLISIPQNYLISSKAKKSEKLPQSRQA
jgi:hypothetical protein